MAVAGSFSSPFVVSPHDLGDQFWEGVLLGLVRVRSHCVGCCVGDSDQLQELWRIRRDLAVTGDYGDEVVL